jgi:hypothetical protein
MQINAASSTCFSVRDQVTTSAHFVRKYLCLKTLPILQLHCNNQKLGSVPNCEPKYKS